MNRAIAWIAAEADPGPQEDLRPRSDSAENADAVPVPRKPPGRVGGRRGASAAAGLPRHTFPSAPMKAQDKAHGIRQTHGVQSSELDAGETPPSEVQAGQLQPGGPRLGEAGSGLDPGAGLEPVVSESEERERRVYRARTVAMLRRYMRYSLETGRLPSILGREFFRAKVTSYTVMTFEDRVIFVHDMEICLRRLDEFSRQLIARHILQEHDRENTARLLGCNEKTVRRLVPMVLDQLSEILRDSGLMEPAGSNSKKSCQEGENDRIALSDSEQGENKV